MPSVVRPWLFLAVAFVARAADSVVLVSAPTRYDEGWAKVVAALETAHTAKVLVFRASPAEQQEELRRLQPRFVTWVARPEELGPKAAVVMHRLARENDGDPYEDFQWGVVTGLDAAQALKLAAPGQPLTIRTVGAGTSFAMECVEKGYWFSEFKAGERWEKAAGGAPREVAGPKDSTAQIVARLNEGNTDLFITSGHATEHDWQPGYRYRNGTFGHKDGVILGKALDGTVHRLDASNPKVYLPIGNCLMGNVPGGDCMALSWMASGGSGRWSAMSSLPGSVTLAGGSWITSWSSRAALTSTRLGWPTTRPCSGGSRRSRPDGCPPGIAGVWSSTAI